ncbi:hypothetical protein [Fluviicola chungangensis]|uniref:Uncharacterized protein n=1 Tax=Fluviicola chungangensis TaxID=2597671 RepID=A0A556MN17_9FLAO|nr:hypothetical protein [Fluviicola chungangensis]TSJ41275.1 hypothetical protein FO442_15300 [Fluviicola chungangensis]
MKTKSETTIQINLTDYPTTQNGLSDFRNRIRQSLGKTLYEFKTMNELTFAVLKLIHPISDDIKVLKDIEKGKVEVLKYFKILKSQESIVTNSIPGMKPAKTVDKDFNFNFYILGLRQVPNVELQELKPSVENDLILINELIQKYEEHPDVKQFKRDCQVSKKTSIPIIQFYWRCIDARQEILNYYFVGMYDWANRLSAHFMEKHTTLFMVTTIGYRPYEFNQSLYSHNFDFWKIDCSTHRLKNCNEIFAYEIPAYIELYNADKRAFYDKYFSLRDKEDIIAEITENMEILSIERKRIFKEMLQYFDRQEWLAFYSIALPQIEGLFSEMIEAESLNDSNSLTTRARSLRSSAYIDYRALDYFEYVLPAQRNKFAHGGILEDIELLAFDLITDLECVLLQFMEMENPYIKAARLVSSSQLQLVDIYSLGEFFKIILNLSPNHEKKLIDKIKVVNEKLIIPNEENFDYMFRLHSAKYDFGKKDFDDELEKQGFKKLDETNDLIKALGRKEIILEFKGEFLGFILETESFLEILELTRKYSKKYLGNNFVKRELKSYGVDEKKAMHNIKQLSLFKE